MAEIPGIDLVLNRLDDLIRQLSGHVSTPWMDSRGTATFLCCSERTLERLVAKGLLPYRRLDPTSPKSTRLFHRRDLTAFLVIGRNPADRRLTKSENREVVELLG